MARQFLSFIMIILKYVGTLRRLNIILYYYCSPCLLIKVKFAIQSFKASISLIKLLITEYVDILNVHIFFFILEYICLVRNIHVRFQTIASAYC